MKILVLGGTGTVGSEVVRQLAKGNADIYVLTRNVKTENDRPKKVKFVTGDLLNVDTVRSVFKNMDAVFLLNPVSTTETHQALMALNGMIMSGVKKVVYLSIHHLDQAPHLPHFGSKIPVEITIKSSGIPYTILRANNFYQNDYWFKESILKFNTYPQPLGNVGVSQVDVRDIAEVATLALTTEKHHGQTYNIAGPELNTGESTAKTWSKILKRPIVYGGDDLHRWEKQALHYSPAWMVFDFKLMYKFFQEEGLKATKKDLQKLTSLLGHKPRSYDDFVSETADMWTKEAVLK